MNRDLKFRAWNTKTKKMGVKFDLIGLSKSIIDFEDLELMQYTGLKDKNGKEIYEGDILGNYPTKRKDKVRWSNIQIVEFSLECTSDGEYGGSNYGYQFPFDDISEYEIIGNIYENPELLK